MASNNGRRDRTGAGRAGMVLLSVLLAAYAQPLAAQEETKPYDTQLIRLAEILGAVHYLRAICGAEEGQTWRDEMQKIIDAEGSTTLRRVRLTQSFNKGYRSYQRTYRSCTDSAETAVERFVVEGAEVAAALAKQYE